MVLTSQKPEFLVAQLAVLLVLGWVHLPSLSLDQWVQCIYHLALLEIGLSVVADQLLAQVLHATSHFVENCSRFLRWQLLSQRAEDGHCAISPDLRNVIDAHIVRMVNLRLFWLLELIAELLRAFRHIN